MVAEVEKYAGGVTHSLMFTPHLEVFHTGKLLVPGIEIKMKFHFNGPNLFLNGVGLAGRMVEFDVKLRFHLCQLRLNEAVYSSLSAQRHNEGEIAIYPTVRSEIRTFSMQGNLARFDIPNLFQNRIPDRLIVGLVDSRAFNGDVTRDPFCFQKFGLSSIKQIGKGEQSAPINGSSSLIKSLNLKSARNTLYQGTDIHKVIFIKNLLDFSDDFSRSVAKNQFWYLDSDPTKVTDGNATNVGMRVRALLSHGSATVQTIIPLNRYSFFEGLSDRLLPPMQLEFETALQDDREIIFQNDGTARRIVVRRLELWLWVPQLQFTGQGQTWSMKISCDQPNGNT